MREKNAHVGVLVTATMPSHMERLGAMDEIWICSLEEFKGLSFVLRERVVAVSAAFAKQANKGDNMSAMYDYLVGEEFRRTVQGIVEGFTKFKSELDAERKWMTANWSKKEKHLEGILKNTAKMYGTLQSIAGNDLKVIESFEAPMLSSGNV